MIEFFKYQGAGNDFVMIDNLNDTFSKNKVDFARFICDRRFGVGSDGIIFIEESDKADFKMDFYNPDGSQSFCGNGSRCAVAFAEVLRNFKQDRISFEAIDGVHNAELLDKERVKVSMLPVTDIQDFGNDLFLDTGSPHYVIEVDNVKTSDLMGNWKNNKI